MVKKTMSVKVMAHMMGMKESSYKGLTLRKSLATEEKINSIIEFLEEHE